MSFRKLRGVPLPYERQGYIYFLCATYAAQPADIQKRIRRLCDDIGGEDYSAALFAVLTQAGRRSVERIAADHATSATQLYRLRRQFYLAYSKLI